MTVLQSKQIKKLKKENKLLKMSVLLKCADCMAGFADSYDCEMRDCVLYPLWSHKKILRTSLACKDALRKKILHDLKAGTND